MPQESRFALGDADVRDAAVLLSSDRIATFLRITGNERDAIELHQQMLNVSAVLMPVTALVEIALRNAACERLRAMFGAPDWLRNPPPPFAWRGEEQDALRRAVRQGQRAAYAKLAQSDKRALDNAAFPNGVPAGTSHEDRAKARQRQIPVNQGQVIAQLTLMFWKRLFSSDYEAALWRRSLKRIFPNKALSRADIAQRLEDIYQTRNRIAHHEPVYGARLARTIEAVDFICRNFGAVGAEGVTVLMKLQEEPRQSLQREADLLAAMLSRFSFA